MDEQLIAVFEDYRWNVQDQNYCCKMSGYGWTGYKYPFAYIIDSGQCNTFEVAYNEWKQSNA